MDDDATSSAEQRHQDQQKRKSIGRQKIEIKKVEQASNRYVTFSKRKNGLFKKATELSTLCGAETAVILFAEHLKVFTCGHPDVDKVLDRHIAENGHLVDNNSWLLMDHDNHHQHHTLQEQEYMKSVARLDEETVECTCEL